MWSKEQAQKQIDGLKRLAKQVLVNDGYHSMIALVFGEKETYTVDLQKAITQVEVLYRAGQEEDAIHVKQDMADDLRALVLKEKAFGLILLGEVYEAKVKPEEVEPRFGEEPGKGGMYGPIARFHPEKREALSVKWEFRLTDGEKHEGEWLQYFTKDQEGKMVLEESDDRPGPSLGGIFTGLIP